MFKRIIEDVTAVRDRDPAARSFIEVFLLYPVLRQFVCTAERTFIINTV